MIYQLYNDYLLAEIDKNDNRHNDISVQNHKVELARIEVEKLEKELRKYTIKVPLQELLYLIFLKVVLLNPCYIDVVQI